MRYASVDRRTNIFPKTRSGALLRLRDVANDPQAVQQQLNQVNAIRQTVAQGKIHVSFREFNLTIVFCVHALLMQ
jgi:hypothetical protein